MELEKDKNNKKVYDDPMIEDLALDITDYAELMASQNEK